jgi:ATP-dependent DNA helicase Rep
MSLHAAKGLEFRVVFIIGCEDGNLPHEQAVEEGSLEEERRLFYVGITRARERLVLSHRAEMKRWGDTSHLLPSRFLDELPPATCCATAATRYRNRRKRRSAGAPT